MSDAMLRVAVRAIGLCGPGLADWARGSALLRDPAAWRNVPTEVPVPRRLPAAERRRAGGIVRLSLAVADEAVEAASADASQLATVFTSSSGDAANCLAMCEALATPERAVSPTRFTNSVHNVPAGYWHIACGSRAPSTSLCAYDASFAAGLLEAAVQCAAARRPVLLVAADLPYPAPMAEKRPILDALGVALLLDLPAAGLAHLVVQGLADVPPTPCEPPALEAVRTGIPAGRALPLLQALASGRAARVVVDGECAGASLALDVQPAARP